MSLSITIVLQKSFSLLTEFEYKSFGTMFRMCIVSSVHYSSQIVDVYLIDSTPIYSSLNLSD